MSIMIQTTEPAHPSRIRESMRVFGNVTEEVTQPINCGISREWISEWLLHDVAYISNRLSVAIVRN
jgi:hypothetical protein